jgi:hypothetical protein
MKEEMIKINQDMVKLLSKVQESEDESKIMNSFKNIWQNKLGEIKKIEAERKRMEGHVMSNYVMLFFGLTFAVFEILVSYPLFIFFNFHIYSDTIGWVMTFIAALRLFFHKKTYDKLYNTLQLI